MSHLESTLARLAQSFSVRDIMVTSDELTRANDKSHAQQLLQENSDFDVIPIEQKGMLNSYVERDSDVPKPIRIQDIVSDTTSILDLVDILRDRKFCFVLTSQRIAGYVHFSDLNHHIVKIPFFVIVQALEERMISDSVIDLVLDRERADGLRKKMEKLKENQADLSWVKQLSFNELVRFGRFFERVSLKMEEVEIISNVRNRVCHADKPLVESHEHVKRLSDAKTICLSKLKHIWEA